MKTYNVSEDFNEDNFRELVSQLNTFMTSIGIENLAGQVLRDVDLPSGQSVRVSHNLKITPKYRIILRQIDGGLVVDGDDDWTDKYVYLKNTGGTDSIVTVLLLRG